MDLVENAKKPIKMSVQHEPSNNFSHTTYLDACFSVKTCPTYMSDICVLTQLYATCFHSKHFMYSMKISMKTFQGTCIRYIDLCKIQASSCGTSSCRQNISWSCLNDWKIGKESTNFHKKILLTIKTPLYLENNWNGGPSIENNHIIPQSAAAEIGFTLWFPIIPQKSI